MRADDHLLPLCIRLTLLHNNQQYQQSALLDRQHRRLVEKDHKFHRTECHLKRPPVESQAKWDSFLIFRKPEEVQGCSRGDFGACLTPEAEDHRQPCTIGG